MRIMVTGGAGFVGMHLTARLLAEHHDVTVLDNLSTGRAANVPPAAKLLSMDIREDLDGVMAETRPDVVVHLAAQASVAESVEDPAGALSVNAAGTLNVMTVAARHGVRKFIAVSSASVYGNPTDLPVTEETTLCPISPYGVSKMAAEQCIRLLAVRHGIAYTIIRPANIYGPGQNMASDGAVVPAFLLQFLSGRDPVIQGDGGQTRDFLHVHDMVDALIRAFNRADAETLNVSSGTGISIAELWRLLAGEVGWQRPPVFGPARSGDIRHSILSNENALRTLEWRPRIGLAAGIAQTVAAVRNE